VAAAGSLFVLRLGLTPPMTPPTADLEAAKPLCESQSAVFLTPCARAKSAISAWRSSGKVLRTESQRGFGISVIPEG
jgi:hypothetical protein